MNSALLNAKRKARQFAISLNPVDISATFYQQKTNANGEVIKGKTTEDPASPKTLQKVRISHYKKDITEEKRNPTPDTNTDDLYIISDYNTPLKIGYYFTYNDRDYVTRTAERQLQYGGVIGYRARLEDITK